MDIYTKEELYKTFLIGIEIPKIVQEKSFGQPAGVVLGSELLKGRLNSVLGWLLDDRITKQEANRIWDFFYSTHRKSFVTGNYESFEVSDKDFNAAKDKFLAIYECHSAVKSIIEGENN